jgi:hypothetical protein
MKTRLVFLLIVLVACATLTATGAAVASTAAKTIITIEGPQGDFQGEIHSVKSCLGGRKVKVYKQSGSQQDPAADTVIASDTSERHGSIGEWSVGNTGFKSGKFYARVSKAPGCRGALSETIKL